MDRIFRQDIHLIIDQLNIVKQTISYEDWESTFGSNRRTFGVSYNATQRGDIKYSPPVGDQSNIWFAFSEPLEPSAVSDFFLYIALTDMSTYEHRASVMRQLKACYEAQKEGSYEAGSGQKRRIWRMLRDMTGYVPLNLRQAFEGICEGMLAEGNLKKYEDEYDRLENMIHAEYEIRKTEERSGILAGVNGMEGEDKKAYWDRIMILDAPNQMKHEQLNFRYLLVDSFTIYGHCQNPRVACKLYKEALISAHNLALSPTYETHRTLYSDLAELYKDVFEKDKSGKDKGGAFEPLVLFMLQHAAMDLSMYRPTRENMNVLDRDGEVWTASINDKKMVFLARPDAEEDKGGSHSSVEQKDDEQETRAGAKSKSKTTEVLSEVEEEGWYLHLLKGETFPAIDTVLEYKYVDGRPSDFVLVQVTTSRPVIHAGSRKPDRLLLTKKKDEEEEKEHEQKGTGKKEEIKDKIRKLLKLSGEPEEAQKGKVGFVYIVLLDEDKKESDYHIDQVARDREDFDTELIDWFGEYIMPGDLGDLQAMLAIEKRHREAEEARQAEEAREAAREAARQAREERQR